MHVRLRDEREVRAPQRRREEGPCRAPAAAAALVHLEVRVAEVVAAIEFGNLGNAALGGGVAPRVEDFPFHARLLHVQLALGAVMLVRAAEMAFSALEPRKHVVPRPVAIAERLPQVVVAPLAAHVHHRIDRRAASEHLAARVAEAAAVEARVGLRPEAPVRARIADREEIADGDVDPVPVVLAARFDEQHARLSVPREAIGEHASGAARADDDVVEFPE